MLGVGRAAWNDQLDRGSLERLTGKKRDAHQIVRDMAHAIDSTIPELTIQAATANRIARFGGALINMPEETRRVLLALQRMGKRIGLVSNADVMEVAAWAQCPVAGLFDSTVFSCHAGCVKPEAEIYQLSLRELRVAPSECVFVGDGGSNELAGARAVGLTTVMMAGIIRGIWPERIQERQRDADYTIERLAELVADSDCSLDQTAAKAH